MVTWILQFTGSKDMKLKNFLTEEKENKVQDEIIKFFMSNPKPEDKQVHALANKLGIDEHEFEDHIYSLLGSILGAGKSKEKKFEEAMADKKQLKMGIEVEMEHTSNPILAKRIALDHLAEIPDYYTRLDKMESEAGVKHH